MGERPARIAATLLAAFAATTPARAQEFAFVLEAPDAIHEGERLEAAVRLDSENLPPDASGPGGWQLGVAHTGLAILEATVDGTDAAAWIDEGFERTEITRGPGNRGFVSVVVLSLQGPVTLPAGARPVIARAVYTVPPPACGGGARLCVRDGLRGSGEAVRNAVSWQGRSVPATPSDAVWDGCAPNARRLLLEGPEDPAAAPAPGRRARAEVRVALEQAAPSASAVEIAVAHDDRAAALADIELARAVLEDRLGTDGYALLEATTGPGNTGFAARIELSFEGRAVLPAPRVPLVLATYTTRRPPRAGEEVHAELRFASSRRTSTGRIVNDVRPEGPLELSPALDLRFVAAPVPFVRGDATGDGTIDIGDPIAVLARLFLAGADVCLDAADANADASLDLSDAVWTLRHLFLGGAPPPAPHPGCGAPPAVLGCSVTACP